jgi:DNA repair exonuclease SbcCD ATPase subunit
MAKTPEASPMKSAAEELELLRKTLRRCVDAYTTRLETQISEVRNRILEHVSEQKIPQTRIRDLRDILTLCRTLEVRADKARRKDLKKIEGVIDELQVLVKDW